MNKTKGIFFTRKDALLLSYRRPFLLLYMADKNIIDARLLLRLLSVNIFLYR